jgi:hypothetical protein
MELGITMRYYRYCGLVAKLVTNFYHRKMNKFQVY